MKSFALALLFFTAVGSVCAPALYIRARDYTAMKVKDPMFVILPSVALAVGAAIFCYAVLGNYFIAVGWHLRHGNHTVIRGYRVSVPLLWWREDYYGGNIGLVRAVSRYPFEEDGALEWSPVGKSPVAATEDQTLDMAQQGAHHPTFADKPGDVISVMPLRRTRSTMYCVHEEIPDFSTLACYLAGAPVVLRYSGDPRFEKDAEAILSSMR